MVNPAKLGMKVKGRGHGRRRIVSFLKSVNCLILIKVVTSSGFPPRDLGIEDKALKCIRWAVPVSRGREEGGVQAIGPGKGGEKGPLGRKKTKREGEQAGPGPGGQEAWSWHRKASGALT